MIVGATKTDLSGTGPLGLLHDNKADAAKSDSSAMSAFAKAIGDFELSKSELKNESVEFSKLAQDLLEKPVLSDLEARTALDRLARNLSASTVSRELAELSPRVAPLVKANSELLSDFIEIARAGERGRLAPESLSKLFEQLNRLFDAVVLPSRRELAVEHFLRAIGIAFSRDLSEPLANMDLCQYMLLFNYPDKAAELLLSILTSTRVNTEELAIRAFKFDLQRSKKTVRVLRDALEPQPAMRQADSASTSNYFSFLLRTLAFNAVLQEYDPALRYMHKKTGEIGYSVMETEVKPGVFRVQQKDLEEFRGLSYEEMSWINRQFCGQRLRGWLPDRLKMAEA